MVKIVIDAGHGKNTPGRRTMKKFNNRVWTEWELNNRIAVKTENLLKDYDVEVVRLDDRTGKRDIPLRERTNKANKYNNAYLLSIHHNAGINGGKGGGLTTFIANNAQGKSKQLQKPFYDTLIKNGALKGNRVNPNSEAAFWILRNQKHPSILVEYGFMDSATDVPIIVTEAYADKMARGNVEFLVKEFNLKRLNKPVEETKLPEGEYFRVVVGSYRERANANRIQDKLKKAGFDSFLTIYKE